MVFLTFYKIGGGQGIIPGWTSLAVAVLFLGGVQLLAVGILGEYIGRIYEEVKRRPLYSCAIPSTSSPRNKVRHGILRQVREQL